MYTKKPNVIRKHHRAKRRNNLQKKHKNTFFLLTIISLLLACFVLTVLIFKRTVFHEKYTIENVIYHTDSVDLYDDPYFYKDITHNFVGRNYFWTKRIIKSSLQTKIQKQYPLVQSLSLDLQGENSILISIEFKQPLFRFRTPTNRFAVYQDAIYALTETNKLGKDTYIIDLPSYTSGFQNLDGILYHTSPNKLYAITEAIFNTLDEKNIEEYIYLPGGKLIFLQYKGKQVFFNIKQNIDTQLLKLIDLENRYKEFPQTKIIDVGSIEDIIIQ